VRDSNRREYLLSLCLEKENGGKKKGEGRDGEGPGQFFHPGARRGRRAWKCFGACPRRERKLGQKKKGEKSSNLRLCYWG